MNELDTLEFGEVIKKDLGSENSSMLRGISVLESLASLREPASLAQLMQITKMPKASLHRTLAIFEEAGLLVVRETKQIGFPEDLFDVKMFLLMKIPGSACEN